jgi:hemolysin D
LICTGTSKSRLIAEQNNTIAKLAKFTAERSRRQAEITTAREVVAKLETTVPLAQAREADFRKLVEQRYMSGHATQDRTRERIELERDLATQRARLNEAHATLQEADQTRSACLAETRRSLYER